MRKGIEFFPVECHQSTAEQLLEARFGCCGMGILIALYRKIYTEDGYYCRWDAPISSLFAHYLHIDQDLLSDFVSAALELGVFHLPSYEQHGILTSVPIQENYFYAVARRKHLDIRREYLLLPDEKLPRFLQSQPQNDTDSQDSADKNPKNDDKNQHSIGEEKIGEESIQEDSRAEERIGTPALTLRQTENTAPSPAPQTESLNAFGLFRNVFLTQSDVQRLKQQFGDANVKQYIERMSAYLHSSGKRYEDYAAKLAGWMARDCVQPVDPANASSYDLEELRLLKNRF